MLNSNKLSCLAILIREALQPDLLEIQNLFTEEEKILLDEFLKDNFNEKKIYLAEINKKSIGAIGINIAKNEINFLFVSKEWRNQLVGSQLLEFVEALVLKQDQPILVDLIKQDQELELFFCKHNYEAYSSLNSTKKFKHQRAT